MTILPRLLAAVSSFAVAAIVFLFWYSRPPAPDAFYDAPESLPSAPRALLRHEPFTPGVPPGAKEDYPAPCTVRPRESAAVAWRSSCVQNSSGSPSASAARISAVAT